MNPGDFRKRRVLLLCSRRHVMSVVRSVLAMAGVGRVLPIEEPLRALEILHTEGFDAVFCDCAVQPVNGQAFPRAVRADPAVLNPMIPIFELHDFVSRADVERSRDSGVTDVLLYPVSPRTVATKLGEALSRPRAFVATPNFFGPDRRALQHGYGGQERRLQAPKKVPVDIGGRTPPS